MVLAAKYIHQNGRADLDRAEAGKRTAAG